MTVLCRCVVRKMSSASPARARACPRLLLPCPSIPLVPVLCPFVFTFFRLFHRLHSEWGQMINATAFNAVPVLEEVYAGTTQEWSLRLNVSQHAETHQVLTYCQN